MPAPLGPTKKYKYLIRPDGTIRVATKGSITPDDTDLVVQLSEYYPPGTYFWDFNISQMVGYTDEQLDARRQAKVDAQAAEDAAVVAKKTRLAELLPLLTAEQREVVEIVAALGGVELE